MSLTRLSLVILLALPGLGCGCTGEMLYDFDSDGSLDADDCQPADPSIHPAADDPYGDGIDQNCDGADGVDLDGDGYPSNLEVGDPLLDCNDSDAALSPADQDGDGYSSCAGDCNDLDASMTPNDGDLDGYSSCDGDCDDSNDLRNPGLAEVCDLLDNDCDSSTGEVGDGVDGDGDGDPSCGDCDDSDGTAETLDRDGDGISTCGPDGLPYTGDDDCDDNNNSFYPGAPDGYGDGLDSNCDGTDGIDSDGDGVAVLGDDCNDSDPTEYPGAPELCNGEIEDCDGTLPDDEVDGDGDGYVECVGWVGTEPLIIGDGDCGPGDIFTYPGAPELCSGIDNDCNGIVDDNFDLDGDGYSPCAGDCDDTDPGSFVAGLPHVTQAAGTFLGICGGAFEMGCTTSQSNCPADENPAHYVTLTNNFWMSETEVTQGQWQALMGNNSAGFIGCGADCPMETVNWFEALTFANALSAAEGRTECYLLSGCTNPTGGGFECSSVSISSTSGSPYDCTGYRLPTEAEWEYAARAGTDLEFAGSNTSGDVAWSSNSSASTHPVATKLANGWGLHDMSGNVWEWVWDRYDSDYYTSSSAVDPIGPTSGSNRVQRGGSWEVGDWNLRVARRYSDAPGDSIDWLGFRLVRTTP